MQYTQTGNPLRNGEHHFNIFTVGDHFLETENKPILLSDDYGLYDYLDVMRQNMPMYIGVRSVKGLHFVLMGWRECAFSTGRLPTEDENEFFRGFREFVNKKYRVGGKYLWDSYIIQRCGSDGEEAVNEFYRLFDEFREKKRKEQARAERQVKKQKKSVT